LKKALLALGLGALAACSDATSPSAANSSLTPKLTIGAGNNTVVVNEASITRQAENTLPSNNWVFYTRNAGTGSFVAGPGTAPLGHGSFQISTAGSSDKGFLFNYQHIGTALSTIDAISYSTYQVTGNPAELRQLPSLNIEVDYNGADAGGFTTLVFEPLYNTTQGAVAAGTWQAWDAYYSGNATWWSSRAIPGVCAFDCFISWNDIIAANPNATILGGFGINQGSGNPGVVGAVDALKIGYGGNSITYNFEDNICHFTPVGSTLNLDGDCVTTSTISIDNGFTLDGHGFTITAMDPAGGHFVGAIVTNAGTSASVTNLRLTASGLADICDADTNRLRGILLNDASGSITNNVVTGVRQGPSGCQEGNSIEARNYPGSVNRSVTISGNAVSNYMKSGIVVTGLINATVTGNTVTGDGPINFTAQNGIQVGYGATATVKNNSSSGNNYTPKDYVACGLLIYQASGVKASSNNLFNNEVNQCNYGKGGGNVKPTN
jgi:hypothetical protein